MREFLAVLWRNFAAVNLRCERVNVIENFLDLRAQIAGRQLGRAQPVMADHTILIGIGNRARFQFAHRRISVLKFRLDAREEGIGKIEARNIEAQAKFFVEEAMGFEAVPEFGGSHGSKNTTERERGNQKARNRKSNGILNARLSCLGYSARRSAFG
jgi:hypothetical protein